MSNRLWSLATRLQKCRKLELSQPIGVVESCAWPVRVQVPALTETELLNLERDGWSKKLFHLRCDCGTHMDSPAHRFQPDGARDISELTADEQIAPLVVLHVQHNVAQHINGAYAVSLADFAAYETQYGRIPDGAIVAAATGWGEQRYLREKTDGSYFNKGVFPGFSFELARFLVDERNIAGIAIDTLSGDVGGMPGVAFPVHDYLLVKHSKFIIENCLFPGPAILPAAGAAMIALPPRVVNAPEMIVRCVALIDAPEQHATL